MSSANNPSPYITQQVVIYFGSFNVIIGVIGGLLNLIVFLSLRIFRESPCAFYLIVMSVVNIGQLLTGQLSRLMITGAGIDWTATSLFYCKFRAYCLQLCLMTSLSCLCLATIDQYLATSFRPRWQQWSNVKLARSLTITAIVIWILHGIPYLIYYNWIVSSPSRKQSCTNTNGLYQQYIAYFYNIILSGFLPILIAILFGSLAYRNVRQLAYRTVPLVRRQLDQQLTTMVLVQVVYSVFALLPYNIASTLELIKTISADPATSAQLSFALYLTACIYYLHFASPFYIYVCVSERFRQQFIYVLFNLNLNPWRPRPRIAINQVSP